MVLSDTNDGTHRVEGALADLRDHFVTCAKLDHASSWLRWAGILDEALTAWQRDREQRLLLELEMGLAIKALRDAAAVADCGCPHPELCVRAGCYCNHQEALDR